MKARMVLKVSIAILVIGFMASNVQATTVSASGPGARQVHNYTGKKHHKHLKHHKHHSSMSAAKHYKDNN